jgi:hypothetical protein
LLARPAAGRRASGRALRSEAVAASARVNHPLSACFPRFPGRYRCDVVDVLDGDGQDDRRENGQPANGVPAKRRYPFRTATLGGDRARFTCECLSDVCARSLQVPVAEYARVRARRGWFLVAPGHEAPGERVVERGESYQIVEGRSGGWRP